MKKLKTLFELTVNFEYSKTVMYFSSQASWFELTVNFEYSKTIFHEYNFFKMFELTVKFEYSKTGLLEEYHKWCLS